MSFRTKFIFFTKISCMQKKQTQSWFFSNKKKNRKRNKYHASENCVFHVTARILNHCKKSELKLLDFIYDQWSLILHALTASSWDFCFASRSLGLSRISSVIFLIILKQENLWFKIYFVTNLLILPCFVLALVEIFHEWFDGRLLLLAELLDGYCQLHDTLTVFLIRLRKIVQQHKCLLKV